MQRFHHGRVHGLPPSSSRHSDFQQLQIHEDSFPYSKSGVLFRWRCVTSEEKLVAHKSCINATSFSQGSGKWLASAGDDLRVLLWDFHQENVNSPCSIFTGHRGNIFCLVFSPENQYIYSGSTDATLCKFDISRGSALDTPSSPVHTFKGHEDAIVRGVSCRPYSEDVVLSAGEDGKVIMNDSRVPSTSPSPGVLQLQTELTDIKCHPEAEKLFLTSDVRGHVCLRDTRMAFGNAETRSAKGGIVQEYLTKISRRSVPHAVQPEASSITFDKTGNKFAVLFLNYFPTIYATSDAVPLAVCTGRNLSNVNATPGDEKSYANNSTIKHGSFRASPTSQYDHFCTGSDDFRAYCWKIPDLTGLANEREELNEHEWAADSPRTIGFIRFSEKKWYIPKQLDMPLFRLSGHASIVNSAIFHPQFPQIVTAGVERYMVVHNPTPTAPNGDNFEATNLDVRLARPHSEESEAEYRRVLILGPPDPFDASVSEAEADERTLKFFDGVLRENDGVNVFTDRHPVTESDSEEERDE